MMVGTIILVGFAATVLVVAVLLVITGLRETRDRDPLQERLAEYADRGETASLEEIELSQPFAERVIFPSARKLGKFVTRFTPQNALQVTAHRLEMSGNPRGLEPTIFWAIRILLSLGVGGFMLFIFSIGDLSWSMFQKLLIIVVFMAISFFTPELLLTSRIQRRQRLIWKAMPDALDLLTICVEAGLGFEGAMQKVFEKWDNELSLSFGRALREMQLGKLRREALRDMSDRIGLPDMTSFVAAVIQSEQLGVSLAKVLRIQSDQMRVKRRQMAEELAHKAPIKMLIPMALLIFPSICIVLMTPSVLLMLRSTFGGILFNGGE